MIVVLFQKGPKHGQIDKECENVLFEGVTYDEVEYKYTEKKMKLPSGTIYVLTMV